MENMKLPDKILDPKYLIREEFLNEVLKERNQQIAKWGEQQEGASYPSILGEEVGEVHKAYNESDIGILKELVQVSAVCMAWYEIIKEER